MSVVVFRKPAFVIPPHLRRGARTASPVTRRLPTPHLITAQEVVDEFARRTGLVLRVSHAEVPELDDATFDLLQVSDEDRADARARFGGFHIVVTPVPFDAERELFGFARGVGGLYWRTRFEERGPDAGREIASARKLYPPNMRLAWLPGVEAPQVDDRWRRLDEVMTAIQRCCS